MVRAALRNELSRRCHPAPHPPTLSTRPCSAQAPKSKKEKKAEKEAELERLAEEQRLAEVAEQERLEKERLEREEQARLKKEEEERLQAELDDRMMKETTEDKGYYKERQRRLVAEHDASMAQADWERYTTCGPLPDATAEYAVNENLTEWRDKPVGSLEPSMDECELAHQQLAELRGEALGSLEIGDEGQAEWQQRLSAELCVRRYTRSALLRSRGPPLPPGEGPPPHGHPATHRCLTAASPLPHRCRTASPLAPHRCPTAAPRGE
eukprot:scaffold33164_cov59-Phaeocystis_antarctica.AAC.1